MVGWRDVLEFAVRSVQGPYAKPGGVYEVDTTEPIAAGETGPIYEFLTNNGVLPRLPGDPDLETQREYVESNLRPSIVRYYKNMAVTASDHDDPANAIQSLLISGQPPTNGNNLLQVEAERDVEIIGFSTGDTSSLDKEFHQWARIWLGGDDPSPALDLSGGDDIAYADSSEFLVEFDMTNSDGMGYADNDGQTIIFPQPFTLPWNGGVTLNCSMYNSTTTGDNDVMDIVVYYVPADGGGGLR